MNDSKYDFHFAVKEMVPAGDTYDYIIVKKDYLCLALPADHPMADDENVDFSKLKDERFISASESDGPGLYKSIMNICAKYDYTPNVICQYDRAEAVLLSVGAGLGIGIVPEALGSVFYNKNVKLIRIPDKESLRTYIVAWKKDLTNPAARQFLSVVRELYGEDK